MKIPINYSIETGAWLHCRTEERSWEWGSMESVAIDFRVRVVSFGKIEIMEIDDPNKIELPLESGNLWLLEVNVVNLTKKEIESFPINSSLILVDQDDFEFIPTSDRHLTTSEYGMSKGLNLLNGWSGSDCGIFMPKIAVRGSLAFLLPDEDDALYSLSVRNGSIQEI